MSTGKIVKDYRPLLEYLNLLPPSHRDKVLPSNKDFKIVEAIASKGRRNVSDIIQELVKVKKEVISNEIALEAVIKAWGVRMDEELAIKEISEELAGWILEISEELGLIKLSSK